MSKRVAVSYAGVIEVSGGSNPRPMWPHQQDAINELNAKIRLNNKHPFAGLLVVPTGGGKTFIAVRWLLRNIIDRKKKVLWIAHRHELLEQAFLTIRDNAYSEGILPNTKSFRFRIISGQHDKTVNVTANDDVVIASKDSLNHGLDYLLKKWLNSDDEVFLVIDEAHHAIARTYRKIIDTLRDGRKVFRMLGLSATPFRTLKTEHGTVGKLFSDDIVYKVDLRTLIARNILAEPVFEDSKTHINAARELTPGDIKTIEAFDELPEHVARQIAESNERNAMIVSRYIEDLPKYGQLIVFAVNVTHAIALNNLFNIELNRHLKTTGTVYSEYVVGDLKDKATGVHISGEENKRKIKDFREGRIKVIVNVLILTEGTDLPNAQTVFLSRPTMSTILMTQMIGRVLRGKAAGGTEKAYIVSFIDDWEDKIKWVSPEKVCIDNSGEFPDFTEPSEQILRLVAIGKIEEFSRMMNDQIPELDALDFVQRIPVGIYSFSILKSSKNDDALEKNVEVLVFDYTLEAYNEFICNLKHIFQTVGVEEKEYLKDEELDQLFGRAEKYFVGLDHLATVREDDIKDVLRYYSQTGEPPIFLEFKDRNKCDLTKVAKDIYDKSLGGRPLAEYEDSIWNDKGAFWQVLFGHKKEYFIRQLSIEGEKLRDPDIFRKRVIKVSVIEEQVDLTRLSLGEIRKRDPDHWRKLHDAVFAKATDAEGFITCARTGFRNKKKLLFQIDHIVPMSKGGQSLLDNLQVLTRWANLEKGDKVEGLCLWCDTQREMVNVEAGMTEDHCGYWIRGKCKKCDMPICVFSRGVFDSDPD